MPVTLAATLRTISYGIWEAAVYAIGVMASERERDWNEFLATLPSPPDFSAFKGINMDGEIMELFRGEIVKTLVNEIDDFAPLLVPEIVDSIRSYFIRQASEYADTSILDSSWFNGNVKALAK
jgi:hypothetical protein